VASGLFLVALVSSFAAPLRADGVFDAQRFHVAPDRATGYLQLKSPRTAGRRSLSASLWLDTFADPLVLTDAQGKEFASIVGSRLDLHALFALGITDWLELSVDVPVVISQTGDEVPSASFPGDVGAGLGQIRVVPVIELVQQDADDTGFGLGLHADVALPMGRERDFRSDGLKVEPGLSAEYAWSRLRLAASGGYVFREQSLLGKLEHDDALTASAALELFLIGGLSIVPEFDWEVAIPVESGNVGHEARDLVAALRFLLLERVLFEVGGGFGLLPDQSSAKWRAFGGLSWVHEGGPRDGDGDAIPDARDACAEEPEDRDGYADEDGCPDADDDGDGIPDARDGEDGSCKREREDADGFRDEDGCPEPDNDGDGVLDGRDQCANEQEDRDGFSDDDGCTDADNDGDGVNDQSDGAADASGFGACRDMPEDADGVDDQDGCPDADAAPPPPPPAAEPPSAPAVCGVTFTESITFHKGKPAPSSEGRRAVRRLARWLKQQKGVRSIRIEGHADELGTPVFNLSISQLRALAVRDKLVKLGVKQHIETQGFGEERPLADNQSDEGRAQNRRAEVVVVEQDGCP
jgi:outer membrane protein OmpA-like peptidoglycan-associated protein